MRKIILSTLIIATTVMAFESIQTRKLYPIKKDGTTLLKDNPVSLNFRTKDNGGPLDAIDAYRDGVGVYIGTVNPNMVIKENITNDLVFKYGESAKQNNVSLIDEVLYGANSTEEDKNKILSILEDGKSCDDGNPESLNSMYINKICVADKTENTACDDQNAKTKDDKWVSGLCIGTPISMFAAELNLTPQEEKRIKSINGITDTTKLTKLADKLSTPTERRASILNKPRLLFIARTGSWLLGGYTGSGYFSSVTGFSSASGAYIFNGLTGKKYYTVKVPGYALRSTADYYPYFGNGDLYIDSSGTNLFVAPASINIKEGSVTNQYTTYKEYNTDKKVNVLGTIMNTNGTIPPKVGAISYWVAYQLN